MRNNGLGPVRNGARKDSDSNPCSVPPHRSADAPVRKSVSTIAQRTCGRGVRAPMEPPC
jgi:hypothetical protein